MLLTFAAPILAASLLAERVDKVPPVIRMRPAPTTDGNSATPLGNPGTWVTTADYPSASLRNEEEGVVAFRLKISPAGNVNDCQITGSSGFPALDAVTCSLISARARFKPANDASGNPVEGSFASRVRWTIPKDQAPPTDGVRSFSMIVEKDGSQTDCRLLASSGSAGSDRPVGPVPCGARPFVPSFTDNRGNPVRKRVTITTTQSVKIEDVKD